MTSNLSIVPLGAGDLVDRAVRFYRANFTTLVLIAAPPVIVGTILSVAWLSLSRSIFFTSGYDPMESTAYAVFTALGSGMIWYVQTIAVLSVMGGASRNFVKHLLYGDRISFAETYRNTWGRIAGLIAASAFTSLLIGVIGFIVIYAWLIVAMLAIALIALALESIPALAFVIGTVVFLISLALTYMLFCLIASRFAFVPQIMLVEGQGVFSAIGRSLTLASGNAKRFAALFAFTLVATYSALAILYVPLGWYAWLAGVELVPFSGQLTPAWYEISAQLVWQLSIILLSPVWMIGLCLLYVDERVRHEGYDIELMAARLLGEIPSVPQTYVNPLQPAIGDRAPISPAAPATVKRRNKLTSLGLE